MQATKAMEQRQERQDSERQGEHTGRQAALAKRYGRIGISAVAAAVRHTSESKPHRPANNDHALRYERE